MEQIVSKEDPIVINIQLEHFRKILAFSSSRAKRYADLLQRKSSKRWDAKKTARNVRRYTVAMSSAQEAEQIVYQLSDRLQQLDGLQQIGNS